MRIGNVRLNASLGVAACIVLVCAPGMSSAAGPEGTNDKVRAVTAMTSPVVLANDILNRWEPVAIAAGAHAPAWREIFTTQLTAMDVAVLQGIDRVKVDAAIAAKASYAQFTSAFKSALMQSFMASQSGKGHMKLGSTTTDQVFIPITPCRLVDSRNLLGPISAGFTRNYQFYASSTSVNFGVTQGGTPGAAGTVCPGTVNPNGGAPSAAVLTVTVVTPSAAGNFIMWGGATPAPTASVLNWNNAGDIAANTTVVPAGGRSGTGPGGMIQDFAVAYNGPSGQAQVVVDVVGYFVENLASAVECIDTAQVTLNLPADGLGNLIPTGCPTGYSMASISCFLTGGGWVNAVIMNNGFVRCWGHAVASTADVLNTSSHCCRVPGR